MSLQKTVFGRQKIKPNTFIGGVGATINTAALAASKLGISASRIKAFSVIGDNIQFAVVGGTYSIPSSAFLSNNSITYFHDDEGLCTNINSYAFRNCTLQSINFPAVTTIGLHALGGITFLSDVTFPAWNNVGSNQHCFYGSKFTNFYAPAMVNLNTVGNSQVFNGCQVTGEMVLENLATIGSSVSTNSSTFSNMTGGGTLKVPQALMTINSGYPDPDLGGVGFSVEVHYIGYVADNTYDFEIGGVSSSLNTRNLVASKFGLNSAMLENLQIIGSDIRFKILASTCQVVSNAFNGNTSITYFKDFANKCTKFNSRAFRTATNLTEIVADALTEFVDECFLSTKLVDVSFPALTKISGNYGAFASGNSTLKTIDFPNLTTVTISNRLFDSSTNLEYINIPSLSVLMPNAIAGQYLIKTAKTGVVINISAGAQTSNGGGIDPHLQYAISNFSPVVNYI